MACSDVIFRMVTRPCSCVPREARVPTSYYFVHIQKPHLLIPLEMIRILGVFDGVAIRKDDISPLERVLV